MSRMPQPPLLLPPRLRTDLASIGLLATLFVCLSLFAGTALAAVPPVPTQPTATCDAVVAGKCYVNGDFSISTSSPGAHHFQVCRSDDTTGWGGCGVVASSNTGSTFNVSGSHRPSDGFRRAYYFRACDSSNACTAWGDSAPVYVRMDLTGPSAPGPTTVSCFHTTSVDCWVVGQFNATVTAASDAGSGVGSYQVCRSVDIASGWAGCDVPMTASAGTTYNVSGAHLPADGNRRAYYFRAKDRVGNWGAWNNPRYVRVDRHSPTVSATGASSSWQSSATAVIQAADATNGAAANSGLDKVRYSWDTSLNLGCTTGTVISPGASLQAPDGDHRLYLCARDKTGRIQHWNGTYRIDNSPPSAPGPTTINCPYSTVDCWVKGDFVASVTPAASTSGVAGYDICRSGDVASGWAGCGVGLVPPGTGGTSITVSGSHLPSDGMRRAYRFRARGGNGTLGPWNTPRYVRIDRHNPSISATNSSDQWFEERTATISANDLDGGAATNSGLADVRYRWNGPLDAACSNGTASSSGATLTVPEGDNTLNLCGRDNTGRVGTWSGTYRVDSGPPTAPGPTTISCPHTTPTDCWVSGDFVASVTPATDNGSGIAGYNICRSEDVVSGWAGCGVGLVPPGTGGTSITVSGSHLPGDGMRRAYRFRAKDGNGTLGPWNIPRYVRIDRYSPRVSATNASEQWFEARTATLSADDLAGGATANSGLVELRYRWNAPLNAGCTNGTATTSGGTLNVPEGNNTLHLCGRDNTGRVGVWAGPYRVDTGRPTLDALSVSSNFWSVGDASTYQITAKASDAGSGISELRALINRQGSNAGNPRGNFSWRDQSLGYLWPADQVACTGGGFASKRPDAFNPSTVTLVDCSSSLVGGQRTVVFTVRPEASFGDFGPINDISFWAKDFRTLTAGWQNFDLNFASGSRDPAKLMVLNPSGGAMSHNGTVHWGDIELGASNGVHSKTMTVKNIAVPGSSNLVLEHDPSNIQLTGSTAFSLEGILDSPLATGESDTFEIELDTNRIGTHHGQLQVWHSDPMRPIPLRINLKATVLAEPEVTSTTPDVVMHGSSPVLTFRGQNLQGATIYVATDPYEEGNPSTRGYPTAQLVSINSTGTQLKARIHAHGANVEGFYNLAIETPGGGTGGPFRVVTPAPVVDVFTPSQAVQGEIHVLTITGVNLAGADVVPMSSAVKVLDLDNSDDRSLMGMLYVADGGPIGNTDIMIEGPGGVIQIPLTIASDRTKVTLSTEALEIPGRSQKAGVPNVLLQEPVSLLHLQQGMPGKKSLGVTSSAEEDQSGESSMGASGQESLATGDPLAVLGQAHVHRPTGEAVSMADLATGPSPLDALAPPAAGHGLHGGVDGGHVGAEGVTKTISGDEHEHEKGSFCFTFRVRRTQIFSAILLSLTDQLGNPITRNVLNSLAPGSRLDFNSLTLAVSGYLQVEFLFRYCDYGISDLLFCFRGGISFMVPLVGGQSFTFDICAGIPGNRVELGASGFISNHRWSSDSGCLSASDANPGSQSGSRSGSLEVNCCGQSDLNLQTSGVVFETPFTVEGPVATISPYCPSQDPHNFAVEIRAFIPANYARSPSPLDQCTPAGAVLTYPVVFSGDDRLHSPNPPAKSLPPLNPDTYRMEQEITLVPDSTRSSQGYITGSKYTDAGETLTYNHLSVNDGRIDMGDWDWPNINDCIRFHQYATAVLTKTFTVQRLANDKVKARFTAAGANPLSLFSPDIDWDIEVTLEKPNPNTVAWVVHARHDCMPGYEVYINDQLAYSFLPPGAGGLTIPASEFLLCLPAPMTVDRVESGVFEY